LTSSYNRTLLDSIMIRIVLKLVVIALITGMIGGGLYWLLS